MNTLHIFSSAEINHVAKQVMGELDSILLSQDACYISGCFNDFKGNKYLLESCCKARAIEAIAGFTMISDEEFVTLVLNHNSNVSW